MFTRIQARFQRFSGIVKWLALAAVILVPASVTTGMQLENHDSFCASCHTEPESEYVDRTSSGASVDLASFHSGEAVRCINCHSGEGITGRIQAISLGATDLISYIGGQYPQPAPLTHAISDENCIKCHSNVTQNRNFNNHYHYFLKEWQQQSADAATCTECHQSHTTDGDVQIGFLNQDHTVSVCRSCHSFNNVR